MSGVLVWIDQFKGRALPISWEAIAAGRSLAERLGGPLSAVVFGQGIDAVAAEAFQYGADRVIKSDDATLADFRLEPYAALLDKVIAGENPSVVIAGASTRGRELVAASAADAGAPLLDDVTEIVVDGSTYRAVHPVYAGKVLSDVSAATDDLHFVTARNRAFTAPEPQPARSGEVIRVTPVLSEDQIATKVVRFEETGRGTVNLSDARIIVSGGRGVGGPDGFAPIRDLAVALGGAVGASRVAVDNGWIPYAHQVGQTGKTVSPDLYIAVGISGSVQHQAGMRTSKVIVAVNKDAEAPIVKLARYAVIGDLFTLLPALTGAVKARLGK
ncbi:MAG TPA: electron transfer flavoprotein subunit alpha/FixB family protein [Aggregatilineales bacterium]|nr:electron transfer flavoprotein subunit alpha/FixB family protein [Aggregatilineales bacterium]